MANIKDKIKKLLALAKSPNENEARDAMLKARELMAKNKIDEFEFEEKDLTLRHEKCGVKWTTDSGDVWMTSLCKLIADNYCCTASWSTIRGTRTHSLIITGMGGDVDICKEVVKYAVDFVLSAIKVQERRSRNDRRTVAKSYAEGFILGLEMAFEDQQEENEQEWGLVMVKPQEVQNYEDNLKSKSVRTKKADFDPLAYMRGQQDGQNFNMAKVIGVKNTVDNVQVV